MSSETSSPQHFLELGFLPENLPPIFSSKDVWRHLSKLGSNFEVTKNTIGDPAIYNASKRGGQRRIFQLPHPIFIRDQAVFIQKHWADIQKVFDKASGSASKPKFSGEGSRHVRITPHSELPRLRLSAFARFRFSLVTDVSRCFPSIYTHSIPWALHGKEAAKRDSDWKSSAVFGNRLDFILRQGQSRQTIGIPIGPDTSKIISEIVLSAVDADFIARSGKKRPTYIRHVDDYWVAGNTYEECEKHLQNLRAALRSFELDINESKTRIVSTKFLIGDDWPFEAHRDFVSELTDGNTPHARLLTILRRLFDLASTTNDDGIIRHIIRTIDENKLWSVDWDFLQSILAQCALQFPHSIDYVARVIAWRARTNHDADKSLWRELMINIVNQHSAVGRDSEVIWALWLLKELDQKLPKASSDKIIENSNSLTLCVLAHFSESKLANDNTIRHKLKDKVSGSPISGPYWPLTLEMKHLGIHEPAWLREEVPVALKALHKASAHLINWGAKPKVFDRQTASEADPDKDPESAIEGFNSDYPAEDFIEDFELLTSDEEEDNESAPPEKAFPWLK